MIQLTAASFFCSWGVLSMTSRGYLHYSQSNLNLILAKKTHLCQCSNRSEWSFFSPWFLLNRTGCLSKFLMCCSHICLTHLNKSSKWATVKWMSRDRRIEQQMKKIIWVGFSSNLTQKNLEGQFSLSKPFFNLPPSVTALNYYSSPIVFIWLSVFAWPAPASSVLPLISNLSSLVCLMSTSLSIFSKRLSGHVFNSTARATPFPSPRSLLFLAVLIYLSCSISLSPRSILFNLQRLSIVLSAQSLSFELLLLLHPSRFPFGPFLLSSV